MEIKPLPLANPSPHDIQFSNYFFLQVKTQLHSLLLKEWKQSDQPPPGYGYLLSVTPHPYMGLPRFMSSRIPQMRSSKSYLTSHTSWFNRNANPLCQYCEEENKTIEYTILHCPAKAEKPVFHLSEITNLGPSTPL